MYYQYTFALHEARHKKKTLSLLFAGFCLFIILGLGFICYDNDLLDTNDPPVIAVQYPIIIYPVNDEIIFIKLTGEPINLPLINKNSFLTRAPPAYS